MGILEEVIQMKNQGKPEGEIISNLQQRGFSPRSVRDALNQAQIKNAVSNMNSEETMQLSIMAQPQEDGAAPIPQQDYYAPTTNTNEQNIYAPQQEQFYSQQDYYQQPYDYAPTGNDSDTIIEISEQVFSKNIKNSAKQIEQLNEFKTLAQSKIDTISERLRRIEAVIDKLQIAILDKVGSYGQNIDEIKKEMSMMQDSFSKVINPLTDKKIPTEQNIFEDTPMKKSTTSKRK